MRTTDLVLSDIKSEMLYQDSNYKGNDSKPLEVWMLIAQQYFAEAIERYAHGTQEEAKRKLLKAVTCGVRALQT